ncbi:MAG: hypothetical protein ACK4VO_13740 [Pseudobdellovibrio sp.]
MANLIFIFIFIFIFIPLNTFGQNSKNLSASNYQHNWTLSFLHTLSKNQANTEGINLGNQIFSVPTNQLTNELRPNYSLNYNNDYKLKIKPTILLNTQEIRKNSDTVAVSGSQLKADLKEMYIEYLRLKNWNIRLGLQTYQWGPTEIYSPSNFLFHFQKESKSFSYLEKGYMLGNLIYNINDSSNIQFLGELYSNLESSWINDVDFSPRSLLKFEQSFSNSFNYIGLTVGQAERKRTAIGFYGNYVPFSGFSIYLDGRSTQGEVGYRPNLKNDGNIDMILSNNKNNNRLFLISGVRYESGFDMRIEAIYFQEGYDSNEYNLWLSSLDFNQNNFLNNVMSSNKNGLDFLTQKYYYISLRIPELGARHDLTLSFRSLMAVEKSSQTYAVSLDKPLNTNSNVFFEYVQNAGEKNSEFLLSDKLRVSLGLKIIYF